MCMDSGMVCHFGMRGDLIALLNLKIHDDVKQ